MNVIYLSIHRDWNWSEWNEIEFYIIFFIFISFQFKPSFHIYLSLLTHLRICAIFYFPQRITSIIPTFTCVQYIWHYYVWLFFYYYYVWSDCSGRWMNNWLNDDDDDGELLHYIKFIINMMMFLYNVFIVYNYHSVLRF